MISSVLLCYSIEGCQGAKVEALPLDRLKALLRKYGESG
jgi:hypothetical protein